jgi:hypothetical protein
MFEMFVGFGLTIISLILGFCMGLMASKKTD